MVMASGTNYSFSKEMSIRRRIASIFNKREEDFPSLREYNDYLEEVEDMTFNLIEGIDVPAIEAKIAKYQEENAEQIIIARARKAEELAAALRASKGPPQNDANDMSLSSSDELQWNEKLTNIAAPFRGKFNTGNGSHQGSVAGQGYYAPTAHPGGGLAQPRPTGMAPQPLPIVGGMFDPLQGHGADDEETLRLKAEKGAQAGGWTPELGKKRALEEAFNSIWL